MEPPTKRLFSPTRIVALALIALALAGLAYLRFSSGSGEVSVPQGAHAGQLVLHPCTYATEQGGYAADCGTLVVPENRHDCALAADRAAGEAHPRALGAPGRAGVPAAGRPRADEHGLPGREPLRGRPRRRARRVPRRRRLVRARLSRGGLRDEALARLPRQRLLRRVRQGALRVRPAVAARRRRPGRLLAARACGRPRSRAGGARLPADRPAQRERRHANRADLRLAASGEHPPLGDGRGQPAGQLRLVPAPQRRAAAQVRGALRAGRGLQLPDERPRRHHPRDLPDDSRPLGLPADQAGKRAGRRVLRPDALDGRGRADRGAADDRGLARRVGGRPERALAPLDDVAADLPRDAGEGRRRRGGAHRRPLRAALLRARIAAATRSSAALRPTSSGPAASCSTPGPPTPTRTSTRRCGTRASRRC